MTGEGFRRTTARWRSPGLDTFSSPTFVPSHQSSNNCHCLASGGSWRTKWLLHCVNVPCCTASCSFWPFLSALKVRFYSLSLFAQMWICAVRLLPHSQYTLKIMAHTWYLFHIYLFSLAKWARMLNSKHLMLVPPMRLDVVYGIKGEFYTAFPRYP